MAIPFDKRCGSQRGFSLIEVLLAVTIMAVLSTGVYSVFAQGLKLWKRAVEIKPDFETEIVFEKTAQDLKSMMRAQKPSFKGEKDILEFFSYAPQDLVDEKGEYRIKSPVWIRYRYDASEQTLLRSEETLKQVLAPEKLKGTPPFKPVSAKLKECTFEYYHEDPVKKTFQWKSFWREICPPRAIRVSLRYDEGVRDSGRFKIFSLPAGGCSA